MSGTSREIRTLLVVDRSRTGHRGAPRPKEELRVTLDAFETDRGKVYPYVNLRMWCELEGEMRPTKKGVTVRLHEIADVVRALSSASESETE